MTDVQARSETLDELLEVATDARVLRGHAAAGATRSGFPTVQALQSGVSPERLLERISSADREVIAMLGEQGYADGFAQGLAQGRQQGRVEAFDEVATCAATALAALGNATDHLLARDALVLDQLQSEIVDFAVDVVEALLGHELLFTPDAGRVAVLRALGLVPDRGAMIARLHPDDLATIGAVDTISPGRDITVVADARIERGGCVVDVGACRVDAQLSAALDRVRVALRDPVTA